MARKEDLKPIALTEERAGQEVNAKEKGLTHELCRKWKLYCPECYQFVHFRKSDKIQRSYFAHYDVEDKSCQYREPSYSIRREHNTETSESQGQDLEKIQEEFGKIFFDFYREIRKPHCFNLEEIATLELEDITHKCQNYLKCLDDLIFINLINKPGIFEEARQNNPKIYLGVLRVLSIDINKYLLNNIIKYII